MLWLTCIRKQPLAQLRNGNFKVSFIDESLFVSPSVAMFSLPSAIYQYFMGWPRSEILQHGTILGLLSEVFGFVIFGKLSALV